MKRTLVVLLMVLALLAFSAPVALAAADVAIAPGEGDGGGGECYIFVWESPYGGTITFVEGSICIAYNWIYMP
jgi:hypothetical protein